MSSKTPSGLANGSGTHGTESDSLEDTLNQILAEADAPAASGSEKPAEPGADEVPTPIAGLTPVSDQDLPSEAVAAEAAAVEPAPAVPVRTPEELASMSGPALVDDVKEEATDVESAEALAAAVAATAVAEVPADQVGTPVRAVEVAELAKGTVPQEEIITATGEVSRHEVITAQNVGSYTPPKEAHRPREAKAVPLDDQARDERARALRAEEPLLTPPAPAFLGSAPATEARDDESELEMSDLSYDQAESPSESSSSYTDSHDTASLAPRRPGGGEPRSMSARGSESGPLRMTPPPFPVSGPGSGRHTLPPPVTPSPGSTGRTRLPTPKPGSGPGMSTPSPRITGSSIPVVLPVGASGPTPAARTTSAVFSKVQLPLGGLVTVVGAAFGVGLIIGAVLWRGTVDASSETTSHAAAEASKAPAPSAESPAPVPPPAVPAAPVAPASSPPPAAAVAAAPAVPAPPAPPPAPSAAVPSSPIPAAVEPATVAADATAAAKKATAAASKPARPKRTASASPTAGKTDAPAGKAKAAAWVDPFAQ